MEQLRKTCNECGIEKPLTGFHRHKSGRLGRNPKCKECIKRYNKENYDSEATKYRKVKSKYGLTREQFDVLPNYCEICNSTEDLVVDHQEKPFKVRGRLCRRCNIGIGNLTHDISKLESAILYLKNK